MDRLREKIADGWVLNSIENMLKAGVMEDGILHKTTKGTIRDVTKRSQGVNLKAVIDKLNPVVRGHVNYFRLSNVLSG